MTRLIVFSTFLTLMLVVLNLRDNQGLPTAKSYFDFNDYQKKHVAEIKLREELAAPKVVEVVEEVVVEAPVLVLTTESQIRGEKLYKKCITCHGPQAQGKKSQKAPKLAGQYAWYVSDKIKQMQDGVWENKVMYPYIKKLTAQDREDLGNYIAAYKW